MTAMSLICGALVFAAVTEIPETGWEYERLDDDHVAIHNTDQSRHAAAIDPETEGDITVPSSLRNMQVVLIGEKAFYNCTKLTSVTIPEGVTNIADNAFYGCTSLTNVVFPTSLKSIGTHAFYNCSKLVAANLTGASLAIGTHAFRNCSSIGDLSFSGDLISIGEYAFSGCTNLRNVSLAAKSVIAGTRAFSGYTSSWSIISSACTGLTNVCVEASDASLGTAAFSGCTALRKAQLSAKTLTVGERAFGRYYYYYSDSFDPCKALVVLSVDAESATLGASSFGECTSLVQTDVASSNLTIGASAFASCTSLTNAMLVGTGAVTLGESAFAYCTKLRSVELPVALKDVAKTAFAHCSALESILFSTNVTHISYQAFDTCTSLKTVDFAEGLTDIDAQAFYGCSSIANLVFPQSLASIGDRAFECCNGLTDVAFAEGNTNFVAAESVTLGGRAFYQCSSITKVTLPQALVSAGDRAFSQCESLVSINLPTNFTDIATSAFEDCAALPMIALPATLESIGNSAFEGCTSLTGFLIPTNNVVTLGAKAFSNTKYWNDYPDNSLVANNGYILGFKGNLTHVTLPDRCRTIPVGMFEGMTTILSVTIPDSVTEIGARAFNGCTGLTNLAFNCVTTIGNSAFEGCTSLKDVTLSAVLTAIPGNAFKGCTALTAINIPDLVSSVGEYAFYNCAALQTVTGGNGVTAVGDYAFAQCPALQPFEFPNDVSYGEHVFQGCTWTEHVLFPKVGTLKDEYPATYADIKSVVFSSNMSIITNGACADCASLAFVRIANGVMSIGELAFDGCSSLTSVVLAASVQTVGAGAFQNCTGLESVTVLGTKAAASSADPFTGCTALKKVELGESMKIASLMPSTCAQIEEVVYIDGIMPATLVEGAYAGCSAITSIVITANVTNIGNSAFQNCTGLTDVWLSTNLVKLGEFAFQGCTNLTDITLPVSVKTVGERAFGDCTGIELVTVLGTNTVASSEDPFTGSTALKKVELGGSMKIALLMPSTCAQIEEVSYVGGEPPKTLVAEAYSGCSGLKSIELSSGLEVLPVGVFKGCSSLTSMAIPASVTNIGNYAFQNCTGLADVALSTNLVTIGDYAYQGCTNLTAIVLPASVKTVGRETFKGCTRITCVTVRGTDTKATSTAASYDPFNGCTALKKVELGRSMKIALLMPSTCAQIEEVSYVGGEPPKTLVAEAYSGCSGLKSVELSSGLEVLPASVFKGCSSLTSVAIPASVTNIGNYAFQNCTGLTSISFLPTLKYLGLDVFSGCTALRKVMYLGNAPTINSAVYAGSPTNLTSYVGESSTGWDGTTNVIATLPAKWPTTATDANKRAITYWDGAEMTFEGNGGTPSQQKMSFPTNQVYGTFPTVTRDGMTIAGWFTAAIGGSRIYETNVVTGATTLYAHWEANRYTVRFDASGGGGEMPTLSCTYGVATNLPPCAFTNAGYEIQGWALSPKSRNVAYRDGATIVNLTEKSGGEVVLYAIWRRPEGALDKRLSWSDETWLAYEKAQFDGYLVETNSDTVAGSISIKTSKRKISSAGETLITLKATITPAGAKKIVYSGTLQPDGTVAFDGASGFSLKMTDGGFSGTYEGLAVVGARNFFTSGTLEDMTHAARMLDKWQGVWRVAMQTTAAEGQGVALSAGYSSLSFKVGKRGKTKVSGMLADGTKVSVMAQMLVGDSFCRIPITVPLYKKKAGGFACALQFSDEFGAELIGLSDWDATCASKATNCFAAAWSVVAVTNVAQTVGGSCVFSVTGCPEKIGKGTVEQKYLPTAVDITVDEKGKWILPDIGKVTIDAATGALTASSTNSAALKLTHTRNTGVFKGSFKIYAVKTGKSTKKPYLLQTSTATVMGVMLGESGYGTAVVKGKFSMPVKVERKAK